MKEKIEYIEKAAAVWYVLNRVTVPEITVRNDADAEETEVETE